MTDSVISLLFASYLAVRQRINFPVEAARLRVLMKIDMVLFLRIVSTLCVCVCVCVCVVCVDSDVEGSVDSGGKRKTGAACCRIHAESSREPWNARRTRYRKRKARPGSTPPN